MRAGRLPENHPLEQLAREKLRAKTYDDTVPGRLERELRPALQAAATASTRQPGTPRRWT